MNNNSLVRVAPSDLIRMCKRCIEKIEMMRHRKKERLDVKRDSRNWWQRFWYGPKSGDYRWVASFDYALKAQCEHLSVAAVHGDRVYVDVVTFYTIQRMQ